MILRLAAIGALHGAAGVAMGVTGVLAACTVAQVAKKGVEWGARSKMAGMPTPPATAFAAPPPSAAAPAAPTPGDRA